MQHRFGMCSANNNNKKTPKIKQKIQNKLTTKEHGHGRRKGREEKLLTGALGGRVLRFPIHCKLRSGS